MPFQRNLEFYLMAHLAVVLLCIESATGAAPPGGCTAVSANTGTGFGTTLPSKNNLQLSLSEPLPASASEDYLYIASYYDTGTEVRFYSQWGDLRYTNTVWQGGSGRFKSVILKDPLKLLVGDIGRTNNLYYSVTVSGLTYSVTLLTDYGHGEGYELAVSDPSSTLLFTKAEFFSGKCFLVKYLMGSTLTMPLYIWDCTQVDSFYMSMVYSNSYVFMGRAQGLMVYNKADLSLSLSCYRSDSCNSYGWLVDNLNLAIAFTTSLCPSSVNTIARLDLASQANYGNMAYQYLLTYEAYGSLTNNILNFGPYQYVVTMPLATTVINLLIYSKATLATKFSAALPLTTVAAYASNPTMRGFIVQGSRFYFAFIQNTGRNFQSYYLMYDPNCATRPTNICTQCGATYYRDSTTAGNLCITKAQFPAAYGADEANNLARPCTAAYCTACLDDYTVCTAASGLSAFPACAVHNPSFACLTSLPAGFGGDPANGLTQPCSTANCLTCSLSNYAVCTGCDTANDYYRNTTSNLCISNSSLPNRVGPNLVGGTLASCSDANCLTCSADYSKCTACDTAANYWLNSATSTCVLNSSIVDGFGPNTTSGVIEACVTANCLKCKADNLICTGCNTANSFYLNSTANLCIDVTQIPELSGANLATGTVDYCADAHCVQCQATHLQCTLCDTGSLYFLNQTTTACQLNASLPDRSGPDLVRKTVEFCTDINCLDCRASYMNCKVCDTAAHYFLNATSKSCLRDSLIPSGFGANLVGGDVLSCQAANCASCNLDYTACLACDTGGFYFLNTTDRTCVYQYHIPDYFGADLSTGYIVSCGVPNCQVCQSNHSSCASCNTASGYYLKVATSTCIHYTAIPAGFGANLLNGKVEACTASNCQNCKANNTVCSACDVAANYFKNVTSGKCVFVSSIPIGMGANSSTGIFETCWVAHCKNCQTDSATCQVCDVINNYYKNATSGACQLNSTIANYFGPDINSGLISPCADPHCLNCRAAISQCAFCDTGNGYFFNATSQVCQIDSSIDAGYGGDLATGQIRTCDSTGCTDCHSDYLTCLTCNPVAGYYLDTSSDRCIFVTSIPLGYGGNSASGTVDPCSDPHCTKCQGDYSFCTICDTPSSYFLNQAAHTCVYISSIPPGYGANTTTGIMEACRPTDCTVCQLDSRKCSVCNTASNFFLNSTSTTCVLNSSIIDSFGPNRVTGLIEACADPNCLNCRYKSSECQGCNTGSGFYLNTTTQTCIEDILIPPGSGVKASDGTVAFCQDPNCKLCQANNSQCTSCDTAAEYFLFTPTKTCQKDTAIADFYGANLTSGVVEACAVQNCRKCQANNAICTACDTLTLYFMLNSTGTCVYYTNISDSHGADITTGRIARCTDLNCLRCQADIGQCTGCDMNNGYFLNTTLAGCVTLQSVQLGYGGDLVNGIVVPCAVSGCTDCRTDYSQCTTCDTAHHYFLNTSSGTCVVDSTLPDMMGPNLIDGYIEACQVPGCRVCNLDSAKCQACQMAQGYYKDALDNCVLFSDIDDFKGADTLTGLVQTCALPGCKLCKKDYSKCTGCDSSIGMYLSVDGATCTSTFPPGFGPDSQSGAVKACADPNCKLCDTDFATCSLCDTSKLYYLDGTSCTPAAKAPDGMGLNSTTSLLDACEVELCADCRNDYAVCKQCHESMGYYLEGNLCVLMDAKLEVKESASKPSGTTMQYFVVTNPALKEDNALVYADLRRQLVWNIVFLKASTNKPENADLKKVTTASESRVTMDVTVQSTLEEKKYLVNVSFSQKYYNVTVGNVTLRISGSRGQFGYEIPTGLEEAKGAAGTGAAVGSAMGGSLSSSPAFLPVMMAVVALDPTGVLMKFNQILKIINKLYFININYGMKLDAFLQGMGEKVGSSSNETIDFMLHHLQNYRGKLTKEKVSIEFLANMNYKVGLYLGVWFLWLLNHALMAFQVKVAKFYLQVMYYGNRVHLIIFNLVFIDFIWYGGHSLMHARGLSVLELSSTVVCAMLVTWDVTLVISNLVSQRDWLYWIMLNRRIDELAAEERKLMHFEEMKQKREKTKLNKVSSEEDKLKKKKKVIDPKDKNHIDSDEEDDDPKKKKDKDRQRAINYPKTYEDIASNYHLYKLASVNLAPLARVYLSTMARSLYFNHVMRTIIYQSVILAGQYTSGLVIGILLVMEISKISYSVYFYVKYKYLKNIISLLMEVMQSAFLLSFLVICTILHPKKSDEIILDFYQDAGIWIVIASCVAEYLLLLTYIGVAAYDFFKNRKSINRALKRMKYSFIKYGKDPVEQYDKMNPNLGAVEPINNAVMKPVSQGVSDFGKPQVNNSLVALIESPKHTQPMAFQKGMPTIKTIIGKSTKNKFDLAQHVKSKLDLRKNQIPMQANPEGWKQAPTESQITAQNYPSTAIQNDMETKSRVSTTNSLKRPKSPIKAALIRAQGKADLRLKLSNSDTGKPKPSPVEGSPLQESPVIKAQSGPQFSTNLVKKSSSNKLSSLLDRFKK
jgi:hypothetical protein